MKSNRQRRQEITQRRSAKKLAHAIAKTIDERARRLSGQVLVNPANLEPTHSYGIPDFVKREFYVDTPFQCKDCGKSETWTAAQQKWWYEVARGDVWTTAVRCRACRKKESARKAAARKVHLEGLEG
jgi:hypothetical protein